MTTANEIPAGAMPVATIGTNSVVGAYCCPFGSPYGFGEGCSFYLYPDEMDYRDAKAMAS